MISNFVVLIVEDDPFQRACLADLLKRKGLEVVECDDAAAAETCTSFNRHLNSGR
jgi:CheY-like chemotaxis protein